MEGWVQGAPRKELRVDRFIEHFIKITTLECFTNSFDRYFKENA